MTKEEFIQRIQRNKKHPPRMNDPKDWEMCADEYQEHDPKLATICRQMADMIMRVEKQYQRQVDLILDQLSFETEIEDEQEVSELFAKFSKGINQ